MLQDAILHPLSLTTIENQNWATQLPFVRAISHNIQACSFQSVCLNESVYIHDLSPISSFDNNCLLHKCSMKKQSYYKFSTEVEGYALAVYHSKVMKIGGEIPRSKYQGRSVVFGNDIQYPYNQISVLEDDCGLGERLNSTLPTCTSIFRDVYKIGKNACAVGEGDLLIVIGGDGPHVQTFQTDDHEYVRVFDGQSWSHGTIVTKDSTKIWSQLKTLLVFQNSVYMTACDVDHLRAKFYCISLEYFTSPLDPVATKLCWSRLENIPENLCTNLSVLGNQLVTVCPVEGCSRIRMYVYLASHSTWIAVQEFPTPCSYITGIIGLPCSSPTDQVEALFVGKHRKDLPTKIFKAIIKGAKIVQVGRSASLL